MEGLECCWATWTCRSSPVSHHLAIVGTLGAVHEILCPSLYQPIIPQSHNPTSPSSLPSHSTTCPPPAWSLLPPDSPKAHPILTKAPPGLSLPWARSNNWILPSHLEPISSGCLGMSLMETPMFDFQGLLSLPTRRSDNQG